MVFARRVECYKGTGDRGQGTGDARKLQPATDATLLAGGWVALGRLFQNTI